MRIAIITQRYYPYIGGIERQVGMLAPVLKAHGHEVHILTRRYSGLAPFEMVEGIPVHRLPIPGPKAVASLAFTLNALSLLRRLRPDVIHAHELFSPGTTAVAAKRIFNVPIVVTLQRGGILGDVTRLKQKFLGQQRLAIFRKYVDVFAIISQEIATELTEAGIPPERCSFLPNVVDVKRFAPLSDADKRSLRVTLGLLDVPIVVFAGRLAPEKRVDHLIKIWPAVRAVHPEALLLILGTGPEEARLKQMAGEGVRFAGPIEDVAPYLQASDLFVLPSIAEGLSVALLEALATELPVIFTSVGGASDLIEHGQNGWLIPPEDVPALQEAVLRLLGDNELCSTLGQRGREKVLQHYDLSVVCGHLETVYKQIINGQPVRHIYQGRELSREQLW
jgi:glycosyltransferase involved in cell wall biosynthesis